MLSEADIEYLKTISKNGKDADTILMEYGRLQLKKDEITNALNELKDSTECYSMTFSTGFKEITLEIEDRSVVAKALIEVLKKELGKINERLQDLYAYSGDTNGMV